MNKQQRRHAKCVREGRCPHCGQPCAPYYECATRRLYKRISRLLNQAAKAGLLRKSPEGFTLGNEAIVLPGKRSGREGDRRIWPRIADKPIDEGRFALLAMKNEGRPLTAPELRVALAKIRLGLSRRRIRGEEG